VQLKLIDRASTEPDKKELWTQTINETNGLGNMVQGQSNMRLPQRYLGHLVVVSLGPFVFGLDPIERKILWDKNLHGQGMGTVSTPQMMVDNGQLGVYYPEGIFRRVGHAGPIEPSYVCLIYRDSITAVDPANGQVLWTKTDLPTHTQVFGDDQYLFLVETNNGAAVNGSGRALRAHDGAPVSAPDFAALYQRRLALVGRHLLLSDNEPGGMSVRLYEVLAGKDLWKKTFTPNSIVLKSEDPYLVGVLEPANESKVTVVDLRTHKEVLVTRLNPKDVEKVQELHLLADRNYFYLAINKQQEAQRNPMNAPMNGFWANVTNNIRSVPVNGKVYSFHRDTGKLNFFTPEDLSNQMLLVNQFQDMPVLLFAVRTNMNRMMGMGGPGARFNPGMMSGSVMSIEKRTGKLKFGPKEYNQNDGLFMALDVNPRNGTVELVRPNLKIVHYLETEDQRSARADAPGESNGDTGLRGDPGKILHGGAIIEKK
jgi:hypothetical protein